MKRIADALANKKDGLCFGNRLLLPFHCHVLKIIIDDDILMNFSPVSKDIYIAENDAFTEIYFLHYNSIKEVLSKYENIKMVVVEKDRDVFNVENHLKLVLQTGEHHKLTIQKTDEDILFIE